MVEAVTTALIWGYHVFVALCTMLGLLWLVICVFTAVDKAVTRVLGVAAIVEAAREAHRQGRAPILRALAWWSRGKDE